MKTCDRHLITPGEMRAVGADSFKPLAGNGLDVWRVPWDPLEASTIVTKGPSFLYGLAIGSRIAMTVLHPDSLSIVTSPP